MAATILLSLLALSFQVLSANAAFVTSSCFGALPVVDNSGPGCSIPAFVDPKQFGDNLQSSGYLFFRETHRGTHVSIHVDGLSRPDLVLTAWIIWANPLSSDLPEIFKIAHYCAPVAASFAGYPSGMRPEPNGFQYISESRAVLATLLDFHLTKPNFGPLVGKRPSFQSDIPGIEKTRFKQFNATTDGRVIPVSANFLRVFDPETGFQKLDADGRPELVRSPTSAFGIAVAAHTDRTTHGISPGFFGIDHFEVLFFDLTRIEE